MVGGYKNTARVDVDSLRSRVCWGWSAGEFTHRHRATGRSGEIRL